MIAIRPGEEELGFQKRCPTCGEWWTGDGFYRNRTRRDGLSYYCKACWAERRRRGSKR